ncbi:MAG: TonB-dependent receptor [Gammaproteobacteria bacterium]|jgi:iron complex outermembrane receptor protein|nr:TonB-dependent receptor [Gammaproteobacteria bacterium]
MRVSKLAAALPAALLCTAPLAAQEAEEGVIEEIVVTAAPLGDVLQPTSVFDGVGLFTDRAPTLGETLAQQPGVSSSYFGPASSRPIIRGLGASQVIMLSDGISSMDAADVSADHAVTIEPLLAEAIEIIRGPTTLLYGNSAAGGVVNVIDNRIPRRPAEAPVTGAVEVRADTAAEEQALVGRLDGGTGAFAWHLDAYTRDTEDVEIDGFATADPDDREPDEMSGILANSFSESEGYSAGASWVGDRGFLGFSWSGSDMTYGLPGHSHEHEEEHGEEEHGEEEHGHEEHGEEEGGPFIDLDQSRFDVRGEYAVNGAYFEAVKFALGTNDYEHAEIEPSGEVGTLFENDAWQARVEAIHAPLAGWRGAFGLQLDDRDFSAAGEEAFISPTKTESLGLFLVEERDFGWGHAHLGGRVEFLEHDNALAPDYDDTSVSLAAGVDFDVSSAHTLMVNVSRTERLPAAEELYASGAHLATSQFELGLAVLGTDPDKEVSLNYDIGMRGRGGRLRWDVHVFYNRIGDYIFQNLTGAEEDGLPVAEYAQGDADFYGVEAEATLLLGRLGGFEAELGLLGDFVYAELEDGAYLPRIPPMRLGTEFTLRSDALTTSLDVLWHSEQDNISSFQTDSYTMVDLSAVYAMTVQEAELDLFVRGTNLLDEAARRSTSFLAPYAPLPGRSFHAGARLRF